MKLLDENRRLSEQDYGGFLEVAKLVEDDDGTFRLNVSAGYDSEGLNEYDVYQLDARPVKPLAEVFNHDLYCNPGVDQSEQLASDLGVGVRLLLTRTITF